MIFKIIICVHETFIPDWPECEWLLLENIKLWLVPESGECLHVVRLSNCHARLYHDFWENHVIGSDETATGRFASAKGDPTFTQMRRKQILLGLFAVPVLLDALSRWETVWRVHKKLCNVAYSKDGKNHTSKQMPKDAGASPDGQVVCVFSAKTIR